MPEISATGKGDAPPRVVRGVSAGVRALIPDVVVMRKGDRMVILRFDGRVARLQDDGAFWVRFGEGSKSCSILLLGHPQISRNQPQLPMRYK